MKNIVLIGMMGCGKSTVGRLAAEKLGMAFVDTDERIEGDTGRAIPEIFAQEGEAAFRDRESSLLGLVGITGRTAVEGERKYLSAWLDMGFDEEAIREAYERTVRELDAAGILFVKN